MSTENSEIASFKDLVRNCLYDGHCELQRTKDYRKIVADILLSERAPCHGVLEYNFLKDLFSIFKEKWANGSDFANSKIITTEEIYDDNEITNQIKHLSYQPKVSSTDPKVSFLRFENAYMFYALDQECFLYRLNAENKKENSKFYDHLVLYFDALNKRSHPFKERKIASRPSINMDYLDAEHSR